MSCLSRLVFSCSVGQGYFGIARRGALAAGETCRLFTAGRNRQRRRLLWSVEHSRVVQLEVGSLVMLEIAREKTLDDVDRFGETFMPFADARPAPANDVFV